MFLMAVAVITVPMLFDGEGIGALDIQPVPRPAVNAAVGNEPAPDFTQAVDARERVNSIVDSSGFLAESGTRIGEPVLSPDGIDAKQWAVQVASFSQYENAVALRDTLLEQDFPAWLSNARDGNARRTRVAVGPMLSREDAESIRAKLADLHSDALVVSFSP